MEVLDIQVVPTIVEEPVDIINHKWKDKYGRLHPVKEMDTSYIRNCLRAMRRGIIPRDWHGGHRKWRVIFQNELLRRQ